MTWSNHEIYRKVEDIENMRSKNKQLKSELKDENEFIERLNKPKEAMKFLNELNASRRSHNTYVLGYVNFLSSAKKGESSKQ